MIEMADILHGWLRQMRETHTVFILLLHQDD